MPLAQRLVLGRTHPAVGPTRQPGFLVVTMRCSPWIPFCAHAARRGIRRWAAYISSFFELLIVSDVLESADLSIILFPHPTLRYVAKPVRRVDARLRQLVAQMFELMYAHRGVGLAATQVDLPLRLFVMNETGQAGEGAERVFINPVIGKPRGNEEAEEGCLSLPNIHGNVVRAKTIRVNAFDLSGNEIDQDFSGFEARIIQHETDHLDGTLFIDRLKEGAINEVVGELDALSTDFQSRQRTGAIPEDAQLLERLQQWEQRYC